MEKVVSLKIAPEARNNNPDPRLIEIAEDLLERARSGSLRAIGVAVVNSDETIGTLFHGVDGTSLSLISAASILNHRALDTADE